MAFEQIRDILRHAKRFHRSLSDYYRRMEMSLVGKEKEKLKLLMDYLSEHERKMELKLTEFEQEARPEIMEMWLQYPPPMPKKESAQMLGNVQLHADMGIDEIITIALRVDEYILDMYREICQVVGTGKVKEVFCCLYETGKEYHDQLFLALSQFKRDYDATRSVRDPIISPKISRVPL